MGKDYCAITGCHNFAGKIGRFSKPVKLHQLPTNKYLRSAWIRAISRKNFKPSSYTRVCSDHFPNGEGRTWSNNVPTLFLPQKFIAKSKCRSTKNSIGTDKCDTDSSEESSESDGGLKDEGCEPTDNDSGVQDASTSLAFHV